MQNFTTADNIVLDMQNCTDADNLVVVGKIVLTQIANYIYFTGTVNQFVVNNS